MFTLTVRGKKQLCFGSVDVDNFYGLNSGALLSCTRDPLWKVTVWSECLGLVLRSERVKCNLALAMLPAGARESGKDFPVAL